jgi:2-dehydropantoate 2-reductase
MKILIYGAGVIGSIFAGKMSDKAYDVTVLARGARYDEIKTNGIILRNSMNNNILRAKVSVISDLDENDIYDYIIITVQNVQIDAILPIIKKNKSQNIVFIVNNPLGYEHWIQGIGYERILIGFPSAGGERKDGMVNYFVGTGISKLFQSTTFGELNGNHSKRLKLLVNIFRKSGFSPSVSRNMDWWQKTHVAVILPIAKALYRYNSDNYKLSASKETIKNMILGTRELFKILQDRTIKITPGKLNYYYLPAAILGKIWQIAMSTKIAEFAMAKHTITAKEELLTLEEQFISLNVNKNKLEYYEKI